MSVYKPWYLTKYLASAIQSANTSANKITFKYMFGSSDSIDEKDYSGLTNDLMKSIKLDDIAKISSNEVSNTDATIVAVFTNKGVTKDHTLNTIGIVAEYNGKEFLAAICSANTPYLMPQESDNEHVEYTIRAVLGISNTGVVSVSMDPSAVATNEQLDKVRDSLKETDNLAQDNSKKIGLINSDLSSGDIARVSKSNSFKGPVTVNGDLTTTAGTNFNSLWVNNSSYLNGPTYISGNTSINRDLTVNGALHATADYAYKNVPIEIADGTDLNDLREQGNYYCTIRQMKNSPVPNWITLVVVKNGDWNGTQTVTDTNSGDTYVRVWNSGGKWFSSWEKVARDSQTVHNSGDETISGNKKFSNKIDGSITGTATHADSASYAGITPHATYADTAELAKDIYHNATPEVVSIKTNEWSTLAGGAQINTGLRTNGFADIDRMSIRNNLDVAGHIVSKTSAFASFNSHLGFTIFFRRVGNGVYVSGYGTVGSIGAFSPLGSNVPNGFRPLDLAFATIYTDNNPGFLYFNTDGSSYTGSVPLSGGWTRVWGFWNTLDDWPG